MHGGNHQPNHMDILKKFRYNFHYWLRNCYQADDPNVQMDPQQQATLYQQNPSLLTKLPATVDQGGAFPLAG